MKRIRQIYTDKNCGHHHVLIKPPPNKRKNLVLQIVTCDLLSEAGNL